MQYSNQPKPPLFLYKEKYIQDGLKWAGYLPEEGLCIAVFLAMKLERPLLLEGEAGVGKTEVAKALATWFGSKLIRLQCYEGIGVEQAVYEWDYARQIMSLRIAEAEAVISAGTREGVATLADSQLYSEKFLVTRPLLQAITSNQATLNNTSTSVSTPTSTSSSLTPNTVPPTILLIDEIDRADDEFEAFLLEVLSDWSITVPELGTFTADVPPLTILTSNRTRDIHDALRRRCLYHWVEHPSLDREAAIVELRAGEAGRRFAFEVAQAVARMRQENFYKPPSVAESIAWADALGALGQPKLDSDAADLTLGVVLKYQEDQAKARNIGVEKFVLG